MERYRLGFIVNPIAGMGGSVGLKGTDGELARRARALGARPVAAARAGRALQPLKTLQSKLTLLTCSGEMGENALREAGLDASVVYSTHHATSSAEDTRAAAAAIARRRPDLIVFVGGDGTARDLLQVTGAKIPLLGVPSGVKMHSAVFAASAMAAGQVARRFLLADDRESLLQQGEIMDRDSPLEDQSSRSPSLYGMVLVPRLSFLVPGAKASSRMTERAALEAAARRVADILHDQRISLIGPGSTMQMIKAELGIDGTALGIDAAANGECLGLDLNELSILQLIQGRPSRIVVGVVGGQGFLFGRGNQQLSPRVIREVGTDNLLIVSSLQKLAELPGRCLLVDTGDEELDDELAGFRRVIVSGVRTVMMPVRHGGGEAAT